MAFARNGLRRLTPAAEGASIWHYVTNDAQTTVDTYFDDTDFTDLVKAGDIVIVVFDIDGTPIGEMMVVTASAAGAVTMGAIDVAGT